MRSLTAARGTGITALVLLLIGCGSGPPPETVPTPPTPDQGFARVVVGASDSVGALPGSPDAQFVFRFRQIDPASDKFTFQDRELSFYFRPAPDALHLQVENRQDRPVWIVWDRSTFLDPNGRPYYKAQIKLAKNYVGDDPKRNLIVPGMTVLSDIKTDERTVLHYLLNPVFKALDSAFHEK